MPRLQKARIILYVLGGIVALLCLFLAALQTPQVRRYALQEAIRALDGFGIRFAASRLDYDLLSLKLDLTDVEVQSKQSPDLPPLLRAERISLNLSLRWLLQGAYHIEDATIVNPQVILAIAGDGRDNLPRPRVRPPEQQPQLQRKTDYFIHQLLISGGTIRVEERKQQITAFLPLQTLTIKGNPLSKEHEIFLKTRNGGEVSVSNRSLSVRGLAADVLLERDAEAVEVRQLSLGLGDSNMNLTGRVRSFANPHLDLQAEGTLALASLAELVTGTQPVNGNVNVALTASGPLPQLQVTMNLEGEHLKAERFEQLNLKAQGSYDAMTSRVRLESVNVTSPLATVRGQGDLALNSQAGESTARVSADNLDVSRLSATLGLPVRIASTATARLEARWLGLDVEKAAGTATVRLIALRQAPRKDLMPVTATIKLTGSGNRIVIGLQQVRSLDATGSGEVVVVDHQSITGELLVEVPQLLATVTAVEALLGREPGSLVGMPLEGSLAATASLGGTLQAPAAALNASISDLNVRNLQGITVNAAANYSPDRLSISEATVRWRDQMLQARGTIELGEEKGLQLTAKTEHFSVEAILAGLNRSELPLRGDIALDAEVSGTRESPQANVSVIVSGLQAFEETLGTGRLKVQYQDQQVRASEMWLEKPQPDGDGSLRASGIYDVTSKRYEFEARAQNLRLLSLSLPDGTPVRAAINLAASGEGFPNDPVADLRLTADDIRLADKEYGRAEVTAKAANQRVAIETSAAKFGMTSTATLGLQEPHPGTIQVRLQETDLRQLPVAVDQPLEGTLSAVIEAAGEAKNYAQGTAKVEVSRLDFKWNGEPVQIEGPLLASYANQILAIHKSTIVAADSRLEFSGSLPLAKAGGVGTVDLAAQLNLPVLARFAPPEKKIEAQGTAVLQGSIRGTLRRIEPTLRISLENGSFSMENLSPAVTNVTLQGYVRNGALELETASANWGEASFLAAGTIPFALLPDLPVEVPRRQGPARLTADLENLNLAAIGGMPENVSAIVSARLEAEAPRPDLGATRARLTFSELLAQLDTRRVEQIGTSELLLENGVLRVGRFQLTGPTTELQLTGTAEVQGQQALNMRLDGRLDASLLEMYTDAVRARGATEVQADITGTAQEPQVRGFLQVTDGQLSLQQPRIGADGLNLRVDMEGTRATISRLQGDLNGGTLSGQGSVVYVNGRLQEADVRLGAEDVYFDFPDGLRTNSDVRLQLRSAGERLMLTGSVMVAEGGFTDDLYFDRGILAAVTAPRSQTTTEARSPRLEALGFDISVATQEPIVIDNNLAKGEIAAQLRVLGNPYEFGVTGRLVIEDGSEVTLQERRYHVDRGIITFANERRVEPILDVLATTTVSGYDINLQISGQPGETETVLTSNPSLPEPDILAMLVTGKTLDEIRGQEFEVARNQVLSYLTGRAGATLGRQIEGVTGLSRVRIEPNLIAAETDPGARLTIGQDISRRLKLIYSMDLVNSSDQIYVGEYDLTRRFLTSGVRQSDGSFRFDFRHVLQLGGMVDPDRQRTPDQRRIGQVTIVGERYFTQDEIQGNLNARPGDRYDFFKLRRGLEKLNEMYMKENLLESHIRLEREPQNRAVDLRLRINPGSKVELRFDGAGVPGDVEKEVRRVWYSGVFDEQRVDDAIGVLRAWLVRDSYLTPRITQEITTPGLDRKIVLFEIERGPRFHSVELVFEGALGIAPDQLRKLVENQEMSTEVYTRPDRVVEVLIQFYREKGYLDAEVRNPRYELNEEAGTARTVFPVEEGLLYRVGESRFDGNSVLTDAELAEAAPLPRGEEYLPILRENALQRLRSAYWERGYNDVEIAVEMQKRPERGLLDFAFQITENQRSIVQDITVQGNQKTTDNLIRTQLGVRPGEPLNLQEISASRRKLYNTGAFSLVEIVREDWVPEGDVAQPVEGTATTRRLRLRVRVREVQPFELRYGAFFDTDRGPGGIVDFSNRNSLGSARVLGIRGRFDSQLQEARGYYSQPWLSRFPVKTIASPYVRREIHAETEETTAFNVDRIGFSLQQEFSLGQNFLLNYGYKLEKSRTYDTGPDPFFDVPLRVAGLTATFSRESRDEILDATRGSFFSHAIQFSPGVLGSEVHFLKYFGQYFRYFPLRQPRVELFTNQVLRPRLVYATGIRVGLAKGLGDQEVPLSERFFAGGGTSIRGFEQDSVGPATFTGISLGGEAMLVLNNELRFPLLSIFDGVGFVDMGNVFSRVSDMRLTDLRYSAGIGLRVRTPWFLVRLDYGFKLNRKPEESAGRLFFSIGQAF